MTSFMFMDESIVVTLEKIVLKVIEYRICSEFILTLCATDSTIFSLVDY